MTNRLAALQNEPEWLSKEEDDLGYLQSLSSEELKALLRETFGVTIRSLARGAQVVRILDARGEDLSDMHNDIIHDLRLIGNSQLVPELVHRFYGRKKLLERLSGLPIPDQRRLAAGDLVQMVVFDPATGQPTHKMEDPQRMGPLQVAQVFASNHIRTEQEQLTFLYERETKKRLPEPEQVGPVRLDPERKVMIVGRHEIPLEIWEKALNAMRRALRRRRP